MAGEQIFSVKLEGAEQLQRSLETLPNRMKNKALTKALRQAGNVIRDAARAAAPVLQTTHPYRTKGLVKRRISVRTSKFAKREGLGVFVSVKPAQGAKFRGGKQIRASQRGAQSKNDPYYWWWVEFGHKVVPRKGKTGGIGIAARRRAWTGKRVEAKPFMVPASKQLDRALAVFNASAVPAIEALNRPD